MAILNFGSLNIDYTYAVDHFVTAGETLASTNLVVNAGGKGLNQSLALAKAGAPVKHAGMVGEDGRFLVELLQDEGVNTELLHISDTVRSGNAIIQTDPSGENCILLYGGANQAIEETYVDEVFSHMEQGDWILLQNEISCLDYIISSAIRNGLRLILNPSPVTPELLRYDLSGVDLLVLNEIEAAAIAEVDSDLDPAALAQAVRKRLPHPTVVLTLGRRGSIYLGDDIEAHQDAFTVDAVDTTGAGDTFTGYLLAGLMRGDTPAQSMRNAAAASAIAVTRHGAAPSIPNRAEVEEFLRKVAQ
ncbi:ribokinase [Atopobium sp. oral taxon 810]|uniref:ribokinase n=1 Tax=Atopobium sp. oral taxon 810 TaxID=712158 RepID=UPI0003982B1A|nr:ribokinase [Atopobium sp. oral taxon 810]ERI06708.1 putative ribokinase [Atopobium sp. oral taxon 810 str. F0209]